MLQTAEHPPRSRRTDPETSHRAGRRSRVFSDTHKARILAALVQGPQTAHGISQASGLTVVQVDRRAHELVAEGRVKYLQDESGKDMIMSGYRVWVAV